jgi:hypothetical protein
MRKGWGTYFTVLTTVAIRMWGRGHFTFAAGKRHLAFAAHFTLRRFHSRYDLLGAESLVTIDIQKLECSTEKGLGAIFKRRHKVTDKGNDQSGRSWHFAFTTFTTSVMIG